ncbi:uncharacterized protein LOC143292852 [Babylonia areolata]|uniref:uncharacterized protein LOC143292852 n=1 Tax=Babylonia areolata TaxID=304850 RepID=UPI003FD10E99
MPTPCTLIVLFLVSSSLTAAAAANAEAADDGTAHEHVQQNLKCSTNMFCSAWEEKTSECCREYVSQQQWGGYTADCCGQGLDLTFHCQRRAKGEGNIFACLRAIICPAGMVPVIEDYLKDQDRYAFIMCRTCASGSFEPKQQPSYMYKNPVCSSTHQRCSNGTGTTLVRGGNASHDTICRCSWEEGFSPSNFVKCAAGFVGNSACFCEQSSCEEGMQLNHEYKCVPVRDSSRKEAGGKQPPSSEKEEEGHFWIIYLTCIVIGFLSAAAFLCRIFHP